jgi:hypothetical protein
MELACSGSCQVLNTNVDSPKTLAKIIASNLPNDDKLLDSESLFNNLCKFLQSKCHT